MSLAKPVHVAHRPVAQLEHVIGDERQARLVEAADQFRRTLGSRTVWNVSSTAVGGGVAEMIQALLGYVDDLGIASRWMVITGDAEFFVITKRLHNQVHGDVSGGALTAADAGRYARILAANAVEMLSYVQPGDLVLLHDPQTAGLAEYLTHAGALVAWRSHIGVDWHNEATDAAWSFLLPNLVASKGFVFSRREYVPGQIPADKVAIIPPSIDPFSPKNQRLDDDAVRAILSVIGVLDGVPSGESATFARRDGTAGQVSRPAEITGEGRPQPGDPLVVQVSRWDHLKDMPGVMRGFAEYVAPACNAYLVLAGPAVAGVTDDPEGAAVFAECLLQWRDLPAKARKRILLVTLPLDDTDENAAMVNALQRHATVIVQKSLAEGFGLTVAEGMWKGRPVIGSAVGGIIDQIAAGTGILLPEPRDLMAFGSAVRKLLENPDEADHMGRAAQAHVTRNYVGDQHLLRYARLFTSIMEHPEQRRSVMPASRLLSAVSAGILAIGLAGFVPGGAAATVVHRTRPLPLVVRTIDGRVRGKDVGTAREFLGVPYAAPPVGSLRWRPPQPARPWTGIRNARAPGHNCAQTGSLATGVLVTSDSQNCLFLNVYTPKTPSARPRPVMVWIHGGGFTGGAGSIYDGKVIATRGNVVVVTINYRLNAFGFLALPSLGTNSGDYGLQDQQAALRWVRSNARAFGGNPRDVTIFGESAGGASVCANMASPRARGLFERAIAESGCLFLTQSARQADIAGKKFAARLGCSKRATQLRCLRAKPVPAVLKASASVSWGPVAGGRTLPQEPGAAFFYGNYLHVPLLQGTNHDEGRFFVGLEFDVAQGHPMTSAQYPAALVAQFGATEGAMVLSEYPLANYPSPDLAYAAVLTDSEFSCPAVLADQLVTGNGSRAYAYEFSDPDPPNDFPVTFSFPLGAAHSTELQYVFQRIPFLDTVPPFTDAQLALSDLMIRYWTRFAATGDPNGGPGRAPHWPRWTGSTGGPIQELVPGKTGPESYATFSGFHNCDFWAGIGQ